MSVREQLITLAKFGVVDEKIKACQDRLSRISKKAKSAEADSAKLEQEEKSLDAKRNDLLSKRKKLDGDMMQEKSNLRKWDQRAEKIKGEREHSALISEIGTLKKVISGIETQVLEVMESLDTLNGQYEKTKANFDSAKSVQKQEWDQIKDDMEKGEAELTVFNSEKEQLVEVSPSNLTRRYEQIASRRGGVGVGWVQSEVCQACSRAIPPELFIRVHKGEVLEQCPSCQRILVSKELLKEDKAKQEG